MGFCLFNNVALAALHALESHGLERVAIIDFDVHHGNGTAESFRDDPRVLMASFYQHPFYPYSEPEPETANRVNIPVPARSGGDVVRKLVLEHWLPALHAFKPEMIFISAGFDAHREDDLGEMALVEADYAWMTRADHGGRARACAGPHRQLPRRRLQPVGAGPQRGRPRQGAGRTRLTPKKPHFARRTPRRVDLYGMPGVNLSSAASTVVLFFPPGIAASGSSDRCRSQGGMNEQTRAVAGHPLPAVP